MNGKQNRKSFMHEAGFGFIVSIVAAAVATTAMLALPQPFVSRLIVAAIGMLFVLRTITRSGEKTGRIVTVVVWAGLVAAAWIAGVGLPAFVALNATLLWLVRSLFSYARLAEVGLDLGLTALAVSFGVWAGLRTDSVFLAVWCFLLVQALAVLIPGFVQGLLAGRQQDLSELGDDQGFSQAYRAAEDAMRRIAARH